MKTTTTTLDLDPGTTIEWACHQACEIAAETKGTCKFKFNDIRMRAEKDSLPDVMVSNFYREVYRRIKEQEEPARSTSGGLKIYKVKIPSLGRQTVTVKEGFKPVHVGLDPQGSPCLWFECDPYADDVKIDVYVCGTGEHLPFAMTHFGTFLSGPFVWHVYL